MKDFQSAGVEGGKNPGRWNTSPREGGTACSSATAGRHQEGRIRTERASPATAGRHRDDRVRPANACRGKPLAPCTTGRAARENIFGLGWMGSDLACPRAAAGRDDWQSADGHGRRPPTVGQGRLPVRESADIIAATGSAFPPAVRHGTTGCRLTVVGGDRQRSVGAGCGNGRSAETVVAGPSRDDGKSADSNRQRSVRVGCGEGGRRRPARHRTPDDRR